jgi:transposase
MGASTITLLEAIEALYPLMMLLHVFLDNARYHHAKLVQQWLARPGCRIKLHFIPSYCPHLTPIARLWGLLHRNVTHNTCYATCAQFAEATLGFPTRRRSRWCGTISTPKGRLALRSLFRRRGAPARRTFRMALNMLESELGVLASQVSGSPHRRQANPRPRSQTWQSHRSTHHATNWQFKPPTPRQAEETVPSVRVI